METPPGSAGQETPDADPDGESVENDINVEGEVCIDG